MPGPISPEQAIWLEDLRTLLVFGWFLLCGAFAVQLMVEARPLPPEHPKLKPKGTTYCPLHRVVREECEAKHHDPE